MCDSPHLHAGCTLKHGSGSLMDPMSTAVLGHVLAAGANLQKTPIQPTQPYNVNLELCWQVAYSCAS